MAIMATDDARGHAGRVSDPGPEVPERATRRRYPVKYKLEILAEYDTLDRDGKGVVITQDDVAQRVTNEDDVNAGVAAQRRGRRVVQ